jgi:LysR family glycine cleavage system transcriptional activator
MRDLPSIRVLRAFETAARLRSYSRAAEQLGLTHGAISHAIRDLEARVGARLFERQGNRMQPTQAGSELLPTIRQALALLVSVFPAPQDGGPASLRISVLPSFASHWLTRRLPEFHAQHPHIVVGLDLRVELAPMGQDGVDAAVRFGDGGWPGLTSAWLTGETAFPVCSPDYRARHNLDTAEDLRRCRLLRHTWQPWTSWFQEAGLVMPEPVTPSPFGDAGLLVDAAIAGDGVALARKILVADSLAIGVLVKPFQKEIELPGGYYLVRAEGAPLKAPLIDCFGSWLRDKIRREQGMPKKSDDRR